MLAGSLTVGDSILVAVDRTAAGIVRSERRRDHTMRSYLSLFTRQHQARSSL